MKQLETEIKLLIIEAAGLENVSPDEIDSAAPLFVDGLGLDSIDALEIGLALHKRYGIKLSADSADTRRHFACVNSIVQLVDSVLKGNKE